MGKSTNGPDMLDCLAYLRGIEEQTGMKVTLLMEPDGFGPGPRWSVSLLAMPASPVLIAEGSGISVAGRWPNKRDATFTGALFRFLVLLDGEIGRAKFQEVLGLNEA